MPQVTRIDPVFGLVGEHKLKVCAYCRVSSNSEDQLNSFAVQVKYYTKYIESHTEWEFVDIFADEGITGTCAVETPYTEEIGQEYSLEEMRTALNRITEELNTGRRDHF